MCRDPTDPCASPAPAGTARAKPGARAKRGGHKFSARVRLVHRNVDEGAARASHVRADGRIATASFALEHIRGPEHKTIVVFRPDIVEGRVQSKVVNALPAVCLPAFKIVDSAAHGGPRPH